MDQNTNLTLRTAVLTGLVLLFMASGMASATETNVGTANLKGFIANVGQWPSHVLYAVRQNGANVWITRTGVVTDNFEVSADRIRTGTVTQEAFRDVNPRFEQRTSDAIATVSFIKGSDESQWFSAPVVSRVSLVDYYPGVTFTYSLVDDGRVARNVVARQGADLSALRYEILGGGSKHVLAEVSPVTSTVYGSFIGGNGDDELIDLEYLSNGDVIVAGNTSELDLPGAPGGYSTAVKGKLDGFLVRMDSRLENVLSYTFIGGGSDDRIRALTRDKSNNVYVTGETISNDFPTTSGVTGKIYKALSDAFVAKLDSTLKKLIVGFYHGGNKDDIGRAISVDQEGVIFISGSTSSTTNFPVTFPATVTVNIPGSWGRPGTTRVLPGGGANQGQIDCFVATFSANGSMQLSRFFGGSNNDVITAMTIDKSNSVFVTGWTMSSNFEIAPTADRFASGRKPADDTYNGGITDCFVAKFSRDLTLATTDDGTYSTYFGGNNDEEATAIAVDDLGRAYITGWTNSTNLPAIGTLNTTTFGKRDAFLSVFADDGRELVGTTYYGGSGDDAAYALRIASGSTVLMAGTTNSENFPLTGSGIVSTRSGPTDGFIASINLSTNIYATYVSGNGEDTVKALSTDPLGNPYYVASTTSTNLTTYSKSASKASAGLHGYVAKHAFGVVELTAPAGGEVYCVGASRPISWSAQGFADTAKFQIQYSAAGSNVWTDVAKNVGGRSYLWKVPAVAPGQYLARVTTIHGHLSELITPFTISNPPAITKQPVDVSACGGKPATLSITASGAGLKYQWRKSGVNITGATESTYTIASVDASTLGKYDCLVTGTCNPSLTSATVNVIAGTPTEITKQPAGLTVDEGKSFTLSVGATGSTLAYQWSKGGVDIAGATTADYTIAAATKADEGQYACAVTGGCGTVTSSAAAVVVMGGTSVDEDEMASSLLRVLGPIPADGDVTVRLTLNQTPSAAARVSIFDMNGSKVATQSISTSGQSFDVRLKTDLLAPGMYTVEFADGVLTARAKVVVAR